MFADHVFREVRAAGDDADGHPARGGAGVRDRGQGVDHVLLGEVLLLCVGLGKTTISYQSMRKMQRGPTYSWGIAGLFHREGEVCVADEREGANCDVGPEHAGAVVPVLVDVPRNIPGSVGEA